MGMAKNEQINQHEVIDMVEEGWKIYQELEIPHLEEYSELSLLDQKYYLLSLLNRSSNIVMKGDY